MGLEELPGLSLWNSLKAKKLTDVGARNRVLRNCIRRISESWSCPRKQYKLKFCYYGLFSDKLRRGGKE